MSLPVNYRRILTNEVKASTICQKSFKKQRKVLMVNLKDLYENYQYNVELCFNQLQNVKVDLYKKIDWQYIMNNWEVLEWLRTAMWLYDMIEELKTPIIKAVEKWYKKTYRLLERKLAENWFTYYPELWTDYANMRGELNMSTYKWAISYTTKREVINTIKQWYDNGRDYTMLSEQIEKINKKLFWLPRAKTIAVTEIWKAYEYWNYQPVKLLNSVWIPIKKKRQTCDDSKVRETHMECEMEWRVDLDFEYPSVWQKICPEWVNCRCTMLYQVGDRDFNPNI